VGKEGSKGNKQQWFKLSGLRIADCGFAEGGAKGAHWKKCPPQIAHDFERLTFTNNLFLTTTRRGAILTSSDGLQWQLDPLAR
jgi:hypothetical protein